LSAEDRSKKTAEIRRQSDLQLKPILTGEQWKKLEQLREERKAQGKQGKKKQ
jgi:Spy/CpxP family protein refolding chaperone